MNRNGFSMMELLAIVAIVAIGYYFLAPMVKSTTEVDQSLKGKEQATKLNVQLADRLRKLLELRTSGAQEGVYMEAANDFFLRFRTVDPSGKLTHETTYRTICQSTAGTPLAPLALHAVTGQFCSGTQTIAGCTTGQRLAIRMEYDPDINVTGGETTTMLTPDALSAVAGSTSTIAQILCVKTSATLSGVQTLPLNSDVRVEIASAYLAPKKEVRWEKTQVVLPVRAREVSNIQFLDSK